MIKKFEEFNSKESVNESFLATAGVIAGTLIMGAAYGIVKIMNTVLVEMNKDRKSNPDRMKTLGPKVLIKAAHKYIKDLDVPKTISGEELVTYIIKNDLWDKFVENALKPDMSDAVAKVILNKEALAENAEITKAWLLSPEAQEDVENYILLHDPNTFR